MASPRPTRYVLRSQAMSPCRGSGPGSARKSRHRREPAPVEPAAAAARCRASPVLRRLARPLTARLRPRLRPRHFGPAIQQCLCQNTRRRNAPHQQPSLKRLSFPYIVEVYQYDETRNEYEMEFYDETLRKYIGTRNSNLAFATRKRIALQFLYGLNYIHSQGFLHRRRCGSGVRPR